MTSEQLKVGAVFSAFRPDRRLIRAVSVVASSVERVVVVDDGSGDGFDEVWDALDGGGAEVVHLDANDGIAAALNRGTRILWGSGFDAVVTFDQDSVPDADLVDRLLAEYRRVRAHAPVSFVVPETFAGVSQVLRSRNGILEVRHVIQSGMLVPRSTAVAVGPLRDGLFIDLVDTEFELRCARAGMIAVAAPGVALGHELGRSYVRTVAGRAVRVPGLPATVSVSTPFRYYYRVRNRRVINREYFSSFPAWIIRDTVRELVHYLNVLAIARPRRALWRLYASGWRDGARGRGGGRIPTALEPVAASISWDAALAGIPS